MAYSSITKPSDYFNTKLYTGNATSGHAITGVGFQPDWVWIKNRSSAFNHNLYDSVRGATNRIISNSTNAEDSGAQLLQSFDSDGFTLGSNGDINGSGNSLVAWNWLAGGTPSSNTDGSITSSVSANTTAGFSIVSYTGTEANATVGHGLGVAPNLIIFKNRGRSDGDWIVGGDSIHSSWEKFLYLNGTNASTDLNLFQDTAPTSSVFYLSGDGNINGTENIIAYCFAEKKGYSKFGSYTGNGNADGTFVYTGFKPAYVTLKVSSGGTGDWQTYDNKRAGYNEANYRLKPSTSGAEVTTAPIDILSNGFKIRTTGASFNTSGYEYIYMAFAENPLVANVNGGLPATAR